jgi:biopolymer transport protein TolQ
MDPQAINQIALAGSAATVHDFSLFGMFMQADLVVKSVMCLLLFASVWTWAVIFDKAVRLRRLDRKAVYFEERFWLSGSPDALYDKIGRQPTDPMSATFAAGMREWRQAVDKGLLATAPMRHSLQGRVERVMDVTIGREMERIERNMTLLASIGSIAPFVGLFGTVWGIMTTFTSIAGAQNTSLAVVAPGIAEALFATAMGLMAAIPAVLAYNTFSNDISRYAERLDNFAAEFTAILSRHLEEQRG